MLQKAFAPKILIAMKKNTIKIIKSFRHEHVVNSRKIVSNTLKCPFKHLVSISFKNRSA